MLMPKTFILMRDTVPQGEVLTLFISSMKMDSVQDNKLFQRNHCCIQTGGFLGDFGELNYADASRKAVEAMIADIDGALQNR